MKDLSHVAGRWWDSTVRQAHAFYTEWKGLSPLQRVQLCPRLPDELMASSFIRTEQRGVTLLLKAVSEEQQKELVVDRDLTSTAILFRLYVRHQPGGPGEKAILLGQLTSLQKASTMQDQFQRQIFRQSRHDLLELDKHRHFNAHVVAKTGSPSCQD